MIEQRILIVVDLPAPLRPRKAKKFAAFDDEIYAADRCDFFIIFDESSDFDNIIFFHRSSYLIAS